MNGVTYIGRFVPASLEDFSKFAKNLAALLGVPLSEAKTVLAEAYGYSKPQELHKMLMTLGPKAEHSPYLPLRRRPDFFGTERASPESPNELAALTPWEERLYEQVKEYLDNRMYNNEDDSSPEPRHFGRLRRRLYSLLDCGFFCAPEVHEKAFKEVSSAISSMEGNEDSRETYLAAHWPPGYWSFLELICTSPLLPGTDNELREIAVDGAYFTKEELCSSTEKFSKAAAMVAPEVYLIMIGADEFEDSDENSGPISYHELSYDFEDIGEPDIRPDGAGLFSTLAAESYWPNVADFSEFDEKDIPEKLYELSVKEISQLSPKKLHPEILTSLKRLRFRLLKSCCENYCEQTMHRQYCLSTYLEGIDQARKEHIEAMQARFPIPHARKPELRPFLQAATMLTSDSFDDDECLSVFDYDSVIYARQDTRSNYEVAGVVKGHILRLLSYDNVAPDLTDINYYAKNSESELVSAGLMATLRCLIPLSEHTSWLDLVRESTGASVFVGEMVFAQKWRSKHIEEDVLHLISLNFSPEFNPRHTDGMKFEANFFSEYAFFDDLSEENAFESFEDAERHKLHPIGIFIVAPKDDIKLRKEIIGYEIPTFEEVFFDEEESLIPAFPISVKRIEKKGQ